MEEALKKEIQNILNLFKGSSHNETVKSVCIFLETLINEKDEVFKRGLVSQIGILEKELETKSVRDSNGRIRPDQRHSLLDNMKMFLNKLNK
ncbi:MAG: hypothetical protein KC589_08270 [Nanoarchaeota archaeon]|nr:hypothetical protein [Nanoarchaeota archaeon]